MVHISTVEAQLAKVGCKIHTWGHSEVKELCKILTADEEIIQASNGYYEGGFALLVATDKRMLLVDRKPMFLTLDAISYPMIQEISLNYRLLNSTIHIFTTNKVLDFSSWNHQRLRNMLMIAQQKIIESKTQYQTTIEQPFMNNQVQQFPVEPLNVPVMPMPSTNQAPRPITNPLPVSTTNLSTDGLDARYQQPVLGNRTYARRYL